MKATDEGVMQVYPRICAMGEPGVGGGGVLPFCRQCVLSYFPSQSHEPDLIHAACSILHPSC